MSKKVIYVYSNDGYTEALRVGTRKEFFRARFEAAAAADELRENGVKADFQTVYNGITACYGAMPEAVTDVTEGNIYHAIKYLERCRRAGYSVYWSYVYDRLLDFLDAPFITIREV